MALEHILAAIEQEAASEIARIEASSQREAEKILAEARGQIDEIERTAATARAAEALTDAARVRNQARIAATRHLMRTREAVFQRVIDAARRQLAFTRSLPNYDRVLAALLHEALAALPGAAGEQSREASTVELRCDPRDVELVQAWLTQTFRRGPPAVVKPTLETWGGVEAASADGRIVARNTLEMRLARAEPHLRRLVAEVMPTLAAAADETLVRDNRA